VLPIQLCLFSTWSNAVSRRRKILVGGFVLLIGGFLLMQVLPVGIFQSLRAPGNPPTTATINWDSPETESLTRTACYDCHSNETIYPWYSQIAPVSWLVRRDINLGRIAMNFSEDEPTEYNLEDLEYHLFHDMPPGIYIVMHPEANLTQAQREQLLAGFKATFTQAQDHSNMEGMD
jgi:hypothetical protein